MMIRIDSVARAAVRLRVQDRPAQHASAAVFRVATPARQVRIETIDRHTGQRLPHRGQIPFQHSRGRPVGLQYNSPAGDHKDGEIDRIDEFGETHQIALENLSSAILANAVGHGPRAGFIYDYSATPRTDDIHRLSAI
jgi:hypothetical protein